MDKTIQSLTQSAIVQKLSETEHHLKRFTYDIPDNAPYRSLQKLEIFPFSGDNHPDSTIRFKIKRSGYLNRLYVKATVYTPVQAVKTNAEPDITASKNSKGPEHFANFFNHARLFIGGKCVETLYPENILHTAFSSDVCVADNLQLGMMGYGSALGPDELGDQHFGMIVPVQGPDLPHYQKFLIPLDFSAFRFYKDSIDTNFLQDIEIEISKRSVLLYQPSGQGAFTDMSLVCKYHTLHPHFRTQVRNANFQHESSTCVSLSSELVDFMPKEEQIAAVPVDVGQEPPFLGFSAYGRETFDIDMDHFATDILVSFRMKPEYAVSVDTLVTEQRSVPGIEGWLRFTITVHDKVVYQKFGWEMIRESFNASAGYIGDVSLTAEAHKTFGIEEFFTKDEYITDSMDFGSATDLSIDQHTRTYRAGRSLYRIPLTMFGTDEFQNGGLDLKSLKNVKLIVEGTPLLPSEEDHDHKGVTSRVVVRYLTNLRTDSKTGAVSL